MTIVSLRAAGPRRPIHAGASRGRSGGLRLACATVLLLGTSAGSSAAPQGAPPGYYDTVDTSSQAALRQTLHEVIDDHQRFPYTSSSTDTWDILELAQQDPGNPGNILDVYRNASHPKQGGGNALYNREHTWPNSYGFPDDNSGNYPYTDCHVLFLCDPGYNSSRSNKPYRTCASGCAEQVTVANNGQGGGSGAYPGNSNWTSGSFTQGAWETWIGRRGDVARALLYLDVRYEGGTHGQTGASEPDLILTDVEALIAASNTGQNEPIAYMGELSVLLQWHQQDPPDAFERHRNDVVASFQGNRNPFIDHPEWVDCLFSGLCPASTLYCTAKVNSAGCTPAVTVSGVASASAGSGYVLGATQLLANVNGLFFYSKTGAASLPFQGGTLCIAAPVQRTAGQSSGGAGPCGGTLSLDFNAWIALGNDPGLVAGAPFWGQFWSRDPASPSTTNLTDAVTGVIVP